MLLPRRLRNFARLSPRERALALRALGLLAVIRVLLLVRAFPRVRRFTEWLAGEQALREDAAYAVEVRRAVARAAAMVPDARCLAQALTAEVLLRRAGCTACTKIGVARDGRPLEAHAWVESAGVIVSGAAADPDRYQQLAVFGDPGATGERGD